MLLIGSWVTGDGHTRSLQKSPGHTKVTGSFKGSTGFPCSVAVSQIQRVTDVLLE